MNPLLSAAALATLIEDPRMVLLDVRWSLGRTDGRVRYLEGHIPGARYIDLDGELAAAPDPARGRHPLPGRDDFERTLRILGVCSDSTIVAYDQAESYSAARLWWLLRNAGFGDAGFGQVQVLDGGLDAWLRNGGELTAGNPGIIPPGDVTIEWGKMPAIDIDESARFAERGVLLDAREGERYRGEVEPIDPRAGHIPGAVSAPTSDNIDDAGVFHAPRELRARFEKLRLGEATPTAVYCGSGVTAAHEVLALEVAGFPAALFPGSWSQWSNDPNRTVATGSAP